MLCLDPDDVLQVGGKALADPLLGPVSGPDGEAEPGVGDLMTQPGPAQTQAASARGQNALGQENDVGAGGGRMTDRRRGDEPGGTPEMQMYKGQTGKQTGLTHNTGGEDDCASPRRDQRISEVTFRRTPEA